MYTPCDHGNCPYDAEYSRDCRYWCGLGVDEDSYPEEDWDDETENADWED